MRSAAQLEGKTLTFILAGGEGGRLYPLTVDQPKPVVPFGGVFRIIDFALSNVLNSGLRHIYILTQYKHEHLHSYVRDGWPQLCNEFRSDCGEEIMCLSPNAGKRYGGTADAVFQNIDLIERSSAEYVLIVSGDQIYHMDYGELLDRHASTGADITIVASVPQSNPKALANMGVYVFGKAALIETLRKNNDLNNHDFGRDILPIVIRSGRPVMHLFEGYWRDVGTLDAYYQTNLDLLLTGAALDPYQNAEWPTRTLAGPKGLQRSWLASDSRVSKGAALTECEVWMSIVSTGVRIDEDAEIEATIVLPGAHIGRGAKIRNAIVAEKAVVSPNARIGYDAEADRAQFPVSKDGIVIVGMSEPAKSGAGAPQQALRSIALVRPR